MRIGCCTSLEHMHVVQDAGYDYAELPLPVVRAESPDSEFEPVRRLLATFDIRPEAWNCLLSPDMKIVGPEVDSYRIERYLRTAFLRIEELGGQVVVFGSGAARSVPAEYPMSEARDQLVEFLERAGSIAGSHGITLALEPLNSSETNLINSVDEAVLVVRALAHPYVKLLADVYHMSAENESLEALAGAAPDLVHVHIADCGRRNPGAGSYPFDHLFGLLSRIGYDGRVSLECSWSDFSSQAGQSLEHVRSFIT